MCLRALVAGGLLLAALPAQTFIVDANNGPGTAFLDIATAVNSVPDGSTLRVRAGSYGGFSIVAKGLAVRGDPNVVITTPVFVSNTLAQQPVELRGLQWAPAATASTISLSCANCAGLVLLDSLSIPSIPD